MIYFCKIIMKSTIHNKSNFSKKHVMKIMTNFYKLQFNHVWMEPNNGGGGRNPRTKEDRTHNRYNRPRHYTIE